MAQRYQKSLDYLYSLQFFGIKLGLDNTRELLSRLGNPQSDLRIIHIAGTNGKGSTAAALAAIFYKAGIPAGLYTSPHLHSFTERVRVDTQPISEAEVVALVEELRPHAEVLRATFFEFTTALALLCFQQRGLEWVILETGMGGRLDATNVVVPEFCLITPISLDHTAYLGEGLAEIAAEKAGIFKPNVPVISGYQNPEVEAVLSRHAAQLNSPWLCFGKDYSCHHSDDMFSVFGEHFSLEEIKPTLAGRHQRQNLALAAVAAGALAQSYNLPLGQDAIRSGVEKVRWPGRLEWLPDRILVDGAHNSAGAKMVADYLDREQLQGLHLIFGCKVDKQAEILLSRLLPFVQRLYVTSPPVDEAVAPEKLVQLGQKSGILADSYADPADALQAALSNRTAGETILVAGSLFLVAAVRASLLSASRFLTIID